MKDTKKYYDYIDKLINDTPDFMMINDDESYVLLDRLVVDLSENAMPWLFKVYLDQNYNILKEDNLTDYIKDKYKNINLKVKTFGLRLLSLFKNKSYQRRVYSFGNFICCPAVSYNMERLSDFKFNEELRMALDWDAWERIMRRSGHIKYLPERLMAHRIHSESETSANTVDKNREKEEYAMFRRYWGEKMTQFLMKFYVNNQKSNS